LKSLSIIIPNWNSELIGEICRSLQRQAVNLPVTEILVIGADGPGLVTQDDTVRFIANPQSIGGAGDRNIGMRKARGEILLFLDHDCLPAPDWLKRHLHRHEQGEQVVGGAITFGSRNFFQVADNVSAYHDLLPFTPAGPRPYLSAANLSIRREVIEKAGEMKARLTRAEDLEWTVHLRAMGYTLYFDPQAVVFHDPPRRTLTTVWRHWTRDAHDTLGVRLQYTPLLQTPRLARHRLLFLWGAPLVAAWATARTFGHPQTLVQYGYTLPLVYLTKLAWCWGAFKHFPARRGQQTP
jgi:GT2 family glycosyltransferase